jgi:tetratricopeptide (TPR) repeat protein
MAARNDDSLRNQIASTTRAVEYARRVANVDESKLELLVDHLHTLAELRVVDQDYSRAESLLREAMFRIEDANANHRLNPRPILAANVASSLGYLYDRWNKTDQARKWYERSLSMAEAGNFFHSDLGASVSNNLGMLDKKSGALATAEHHYRRSLAIFESLKGPQSAEVGAVLNNLGVLLYTKGTYAEAITAHEKALVIRQALHHPTTGEGFTDLCQTWRNLAAVYKTQGNVERAANLLRQAGLTDEPAEATTPNWVIKSTNATPQAPLALPAQKIVEAPRPSASQFNVDVHR